MRCGNDYLVVSLSLVLLDPGAALIMSLPQAFIMLTPMGHHERPSDMSLVKRTSSE